MTVWVLAIQDSIDSIIDAFTSEELAWEALRVFIRNKFPHRLYLVDLYDFVNIGEFLAEHNVNFDIMACKVLDHVE